MASRMNTHSLWSNSNTKDVLTPYAEGLACDNFDKKEYYNVHRNSKSSWLVLNKLAGTTPPIDDMSKLIKFDRVRVVQIDANQFMSCSCGYCQRFLLPCRHVCAVLKDLKYYEPSLFHIRWHKSFNYYYGNEFASKIAPDTDRVLKTMLDDTREHHYRESGKYKGVPLSNSQFINDLPEFFHERLNKSYDDNAIIDLMHSILLYTNTKGPLVKNSIQLQDDNNEDMIDNEANDDDFITHEDDSDDSMNVLTTNFGGSSQTETQLSTARVAISNAPNTNEYMETSVYYTLARPTFEDMMNSCKTKKQFDDVIKMMETQHYKHVAENGVMPHNATTASTYVFGRNDTNKRTIPRKKFAHEKRTKWLSK